ncbi:MAG TPA: TIGR04255 family protein [Acidobacteriaceae bacterium]|nr:TIGR04255 family protein [Acidobacteriaceae bacterium]
MADDLTEASGRLHFKNPPIIEAVIAFTLVPLPDSSFSKFKDCAAEMRDAGYPNWSPIMRHQFQIRVESGVSSSGHEDLPIGLKFMSEDSLHAVQFNSSEFVFSRLGRYDRWESFRDEARRLWSIFVRISGEVKVLLVGVRFINKVFLPTGADPAQYMNARPQLPTEVAPEIIEMFMRVVAPIADPAGRFIHNQALLPSEKEGFAAILLDNDFQFPAQDKTDAEIWEMLQVVRDIKDRYFVALTTEKLRETFDV